MNPRSESVPYQVPEHLGADLCDLWRETGDENLRRVGAGTQPRGMVQLRGGRDRMDAISTCLMTTFQETGNANVFDLLVELNRDSLLQAIRNKLRGRSEIDADDVLQETLLSICRYRGSFRGDKPGAFRMWAHRIAINSACRMFKDESRNAALALDDDLDMEDRSARSPFRAARDAEAAALANFAYMTYLNVYLLQYQKRSPKEQRALSLVEIKGATYKETAAELGIRVEALKMLIFRARRKILRDVRRSLGGLPRLMQPSATTRHSYGQSLRAHA